MGLQQRYGRCKLGISSSHKETSIRPISTCKKKTNKWIFFLMWYHLLLCKQAYRSQKLDYSSKFTFASFSFECWRDSISFETLLLLQSLPLRPPRLLYLFCVFWLRMPPFPQARISELPISAVAPSDSLFISESFSSQPALALPAVEPWENRPPNLLGLFGLTSALWSSPEDESLSSWPLASSSSSDPWGSTRWFLRLLKFLLPDLLINAVGVALDVLFLPSASVCRLSVWAIEAWICWQSRTALKSGKM